MTTTLPTGEQLPEYDGDPADLPVSPAKLYRWCVERAGWPATGIIGHNLITDVLQALQAVGDATLVKNDTYRLMRQDGARVERLAAWLANNGYSEVIVRHGGDVAAAAIEIMSAVDVQDCC